MLVSMAYRDDVDAKIPGPTAFDHAIVQLRLGGQIYWLDGTRGRQAGAGLKWRNAEGLGKVLLAEAGQTGLTRTPSVADVLWLEGRDVFHFTRLAEPPRLEASLTYHGDLAEWVRNALASQSVDDLQKNQFGAYPRLYPHIQPQGRMQVQDDVAHNALTLRMVYLVPDFLRFPEQRGLMGDFALTTMMDPLRVQSQAPRTRPLYLWYQGTYRHEVNFQFDEEAFSKPSSSSFNDRNDFFDLSVEASGTPQSVQIRGELRQNVNTIEVEDWDRYKDVLAKVWPKMGNVITIPAVAPAQADSLRRRVAAMSAELGRDRADLVTTVQAQSKIGIMLLEAVLGADRLPPQPRAETLVKLGETYDLMRDFDAGRQRFEQALALDPKTAGVHIGLAINSLGRHDYVMAEREADQALLQEPSQVQHRLIKAQALYYQQKYADARAELQEVLKSRTEKERSYAALWLYMTSTRLGEDGKVAVRPYLPSGSRPAWPYPVLQYVMGDVDLAQAERGAEENGKTDSGRLCELYFFLGQEQLLKGERNRARSYFNKSVNTRVIEFQEYGFSQRELSLMGS